MTLRHTGECPARCSARGGGRRMLQPLSTRPESPMKFLLLPLAFVAGTALACPGDGAKDAMAPAASKHAASTKTAPSAQTTVSTAAVQKTSTKVAAKPAADTRKAAPL